MRYYTNSEIRDFIRCPQFGDNCYGKWGAQKLEIRETLFHLITLNEEMDKMLKDRLLRIDKAIEYIEKNWIEYSDFRYVDNDDELNIDCESIKELLDILKGSDTNGKRI